MKHLEIFENYIPILESENDTWGVYLFTINNGEDSLPEKYVIYNKDNYAGRGNTIKSDGTINLEYLILRKAPGMTVLTPWLSRLNELISNGQENRLSAVAIGEGIGDPRSAKELRDQVIYLIQSEPLRYSSLNLPLSMGIKTPDFIRNAEDLNSEIGVTNSILSGDSDLRTYYVGRTPNLRNTRASGNPTIRRREGNERTSPAAQSIFKNNKIYLPGGSDLYRTSGGNIYVDSKFGSSHPELSTILSSDTLPNFPGKVRIKTMGRPVIFPR